MFLSVMLFVLIKLRSPSTLRELTPSLIILGKFTEGVIECFGREYLRPPKAMNRNSAIRAWPTHRKLKKDLIEHIWQRYRNKGN